MVQTYMPAGFGMILCSDEMGPFVGMADYKSLRTENERLTKENAEKDKELIEVSRRLSVQQYGDLQLLGERDERIRRLENGIDALNAALLEAKRRCEDINRGMENMVELMEANDGQPE